MYAKDEGQVFSLDQTLLEMLRSTFGIGHIVRYFRVAGILLLRRDKL